MRAVNGLAYGHRRITIYASSKGTLCARAEGVKAQELRSGFKPIWSFRINVKRLYTQDDLLRLVRFAYKKLVQVSDGAL